MARTLVIISVTGSNFGALAESVSVAGADLYFFILNGRVSDLRAPLEEKFLSITDLFLLVGIFRDKCFQVTELGKAFLIPGTELIKIFFARSERICLKTSLHF